LLFITALAAGCQAVVMEPTDEWSLYQSSVRFWGYSVAPGETVLIEAQNSSSTWETVASTTSALVPTHTAGYTGYFFEVSYYAPGMPVRFRKTSPYSAQGYFRAMFRVNTSGTLGAIRQHNSNGTTSSSTNWLEKFWVEHRISNSTTLRVDVHP
jgi:hypothetical protein